MAKPWPFSLWFAKPAAAASQSAPASQEPVDPAQVRLEPAEDSDFLWLLANGRLPSFRGFSLAASGLESPRVLSALRLLHAEVRDEASPGAWLILLDQTVVGLCSYKAAPRETGEIEIGYGIAHCHRGRGIARAAIGQLIARSRQDARIQALTAQTAVRNAASQRVLARHGFTAAGYGFEPEDGPLRRWRLQLR